jgi:hypothetical protein
MEGQKHTEYSCATQMSDISSDVDHILNFPNLDVNFGRSVNPFSINPN